MKRLRISVVGAGSAGQQHLRRIVERADCELVAIADPDDSTAAVAARFRMARHRTLESLLEMSAGYQAIAHKTADHEEAVRAFIEKRAPKFS